MKPRWTLTVLMIKIYDTSESRIETVQIRYYRFKFLAILDSYYWNTRPVLLSVYIATVEPYLQVCAT